MDPDWQYQMDTQAEKLIGIMRAHDDEGIGARAHLDSRINYLFEMWGCGSIHDYLPYLLQSLNEARAALTETAIPNFDNAKRDMADWTGDAANNFFEYLTKVEGGVYHMVDRIDSLLMILHTYAALVQKMRDEVNDLMRRTLDGIAAAETNSWKVGAAIIGAVVGVASGFVGGVAGGPPGAVIGMVAAEMVKGALDVAAEAHGADSELGVIVQFVDSGEAMIHMVDSERLRIERGIRLLVSTYTDTKLPIVRPERPLIITAPDFRQETFGLPDQIQGRHRKPKDTRDLVPEPQRRPDGRFDQTTQDGQPRDRYPEQGPTA